MGASESIGGGNTDARISKPTGSRSGAFRRRSRHHNRLRRMHPVTAASGVLRRYERLTARPAEGPGKSDHVLAICWRQWRAERSLRRRGIDFRTTDPAAARSAYAAMSPEEFAAINGRQSWANERTISRSLRGLLPDRAMFALDLGSGIGESTACLARVLPPGSRIIGTEFAEPLVDVARARHTSDGNGGFVSFRVGSITETFRDEHGQSIADGAVDLVNASGIVGHHLNRPDAERVAEETARVLRMGGIAALDVGPKMTAKDLTAVMTDLGFVRLRRTRSNPFDRTGQVVFRKVGMGDGE